MTRHPLKPKYPPGYLRRKKEMSDHLEKTTLRMNLRDMVDVLKTYHQCVHIEAAIANLRAHLETMEE